MACCVLSQAVWLEDFMVLLCSTGSLPMRPRTFSDLYAGSVYRADQLEAIIREGHDFKLETELDHSLKTTTRLKNIDRGISAVYILIDHWLC